jgi:hypothetical protein
MRRPTPHARKVAAVAALVAATALAGGCAGDRVGRAGEGRSERPAAAEPAAARVGSMPAPRRYVVAISVDALNSRALVRLGRRGTPAIHRLLREGAGTLNARTAYEQTHTLPNHTGMMTGRRVLGRRGHHVTFNADDGRTLAAVNGHYVPGIFDAVHDRHGGTALYTSKEKFTFLERSWDARHGARDTVGVDNGRDKIGRFVLAGSPTLVDRLTRQLRRSPARLSFLHLAEPDVAGHAYGCMSGAYLAAVRSTDRRIGRVLRTIRGDRGLRGRTTVVLTADHGCPPGRRHHDDAALRANYQVPFVVWGAGVRRGADLYALNPSRADPGRRRPGYAGPQPVRNLDLADLVERRLGLPAVPGGVVGTRTLRVS